MSMVTMHGARLPNYIYVCVSEYSDHWGYSDRNPWVTCNHE